MSRAATATPSARSWRDIPQEIAPRAMSREGRKRVTFRTVKTISTTVIIAALAAGAFEIWRTWQQSPQLLATPVDSQPVKTITVQTDGVLGQPWVERVLALPANIGLMELDLYALRSRLMASGQVASAALTREFPDTLKVVLAERSPIVRLRAQVGSEPARDFLVARDGTVFLGEGYEKHVLDSLPWLAGVRLEREGNGFVPLSGMDRVSDLLVTAITNVPNLYANWRVISLGRFVADGVIVVQSAEVAEIVFGTREDFYSQIARLDLILERMRAQGEPPVRAVNLAVGPSQVPVALGPAPGGLGAERAISFPQGNSSSRKREF
jgi:cell division septal protein FtsQ